MKIVGNDVFLRYIVARYDKFKEEHKSHDGDGLNFSSMLACVGLAHDVWIVLQDDSLWFYCCPKQWTTKHMTNCIHRMKDD